MLALQQHLPPAVLKLYTTIFTSFTIYVATALTACGIETGSVEDIDGGIKGCNSTYRLRY